MNLIELENRINMTFPHDKLEEILYHASYQPQDSNLLKRNKEYIYWGYAIMNAAYSLYLYQYEQNLSEGKLSSKLACAHRHFQDSIFKKYGLEDFVIKSKGEINKLHPDIAEKLIVLMYQQYGFKKVYDFLFPFFKLFDDRDNIDYKTLLQEYAQSKKVAPIYEIIGSFGPEHEKKYICKVIIKKMTAIGEAIGKKKAEKEAAKQFALKYKIQLVNNKKNNVNNKQISILSARRKKELADTMKLLHLNEKFISYRQMDEVLMHRSYANEHRNLGYCSNARIAIVGANVLLMLCVEYIFENYDTVQVNIKREHGFLLKEHNLVKSIPEDSIKFLLKSTQAENEKTRMRLRIDILKSVIGMMWKNYIDQNDSMIAQFVKEFAYNVLSISAKDKKLDFTTFLQEVIQTFGWVITKKCKLKKHNVDNSNIFISTIKVGGVNWEEVGSGVGGSKIEAKNAASKDILPKLHPYCSGNKEVQTTIKRMLDPELVFVYEIKEKKNFQVMGNTEKYQNVIIDKKVKVEKEDNKKLQSISENGVLFDGTEHVLYVCKGTISCRKNSHEIVSYTGILASIKGEQVKINVNYCKICKIFFISLSEYKYYQNLYGALLGNISLQYVKNEKDYKGYANESILHIYGYTVNQKDSLSSEQRRKILGCLMDKDIIGKYRIIEYLQFFINSSKYRYNMRLANQKWTDDLNWVRSYNIDKQRKYIVSSLKKW